MTRQEISAARTGSDTRETRIARILEAALLPEVLEIRDESHRHVGHGGWREGGETHYAIRVVASAFAGRSRVDRHRQVNALLAQEFAAGLHALAVTALTPEEAARKAT
ncbi:BolA family protein [Pseudochelatococcus sp. B33]